MNGPKPAVLRAREERSFPKNALRLVPATMDTLTFPFWPARTYPPAGWGWGADGRPLPHWSLGLDLPSSYRIRSEGFRGPSVRSLYSELGSLKLGEASGIQDPHRDASPRLVEAARALTSSCYLQLGSLVSLSCFQGQKLGSDARTRGRKLILCFGRASDKLGCM